MKRFCYALVCGLAITLLFSPAAFSATGFYLGLHGGAAWLSDADNKSLGETIKSEYKTGYAIGVAGGYDFGMARAELEVAYRNNDFDKLSEGGVSLSAGGDISALSFMLNGYFDFHNPSPLTPFIGAGIGMARVSANDVTVLGENLADDSDNVFAYQLGAGVAYEVMPSVLLDLSYRYFATADPEFRDVDGDKFDSEYQSHNVLLGVRFSF